MALAAIAETIELIQDTEIYLSFHKKLKTLLCEQQY